MSVPAEMRYGYRYTSGICYARYDGDDNKPIITTGGMCMEEAGVESEEYHTSCCKGKQREHRLEVLV